jgi:hypothetical protein
MYNTCSVQQGIAVVGVRLDGGVPTAVPSTTSITIRPSNVGIPSFASAVQIATAPPKLWPTRTVGGCVSPNNAVQMASTSVCSVSRDMLISPSSLSSLDSPWWRMSSATTLHLQKSQHKLMKTPENCRAFSVHVIVQVPNAVVAQSPNHHLQVAPVSCQHNWGFVRLYNI